MLVVADEAEALDVRRAHGGEEGVDGAVALAAQLVFLVVIADGAGELDLRVALAADLGDGVAQKRIGLAHRDKFAQKQVQQPLRRQLRAVGHGLLFHQRAQFRVHGLGQVVAKARLQHVGRAALAALGIDADDRLVAAADVLGVDEQIGHLPRLARMLGAVGEALADGVLMGAGKGREHQIARVGRALRHVHARAALVHLPYAHQVLEIQPRLHAQRRHE